MSEIIDSIFKQRGKFILIGLTGRTGSGCSKVAELLTSESFSKFNPRPKSGNCEKIDNESRKYNIAYDYMGKNWGTGFYCIRVRDIITSFVVEEKLADFEASFKITLSPKTAKLYNELHVQITAKLNQIRFNFSRHITAPYNYIREEPMSNVEDYFRRLRGLTSRIKSDIAAGSGNTYASVYQALGDNIRKSGRALDNKENFRTSTIAERINDVIKYIRKKNKEEVLIVIDAFRNPFEVFFFKERYAAFYLWAINTPSSDRYSRLIESGLSDEQIRALDKKEFPDKTSLKDSFISQNIGRCIEISDIHVFNNNCKSGFFHDLKSQIIKYLALIKHPGIITPSHEERTMQIAYTAKFNSGCISRQVGAVVTDKYFSIKSMGWNDVPRGHVPCLLRNSLDLSTGNDIRAYSDYELQTNSFKDTLKYVISSKNQIEKLHGRNIPYCFKDIHIIDTLKENQVHTRSLHAEENAFLQISKYGGQGINGGKLFTTASPCELCAKKAYQLGIKEIYYIDLYPGISREHILGCGSARPEMKLFKGAIGRAYIHLYQPILSYKDEIYDILDIDIKKNIKLKTKKAQTP